MQRSSELPSIGPMPVTAIGPFRRRYFLQRGSQWSLFTSNARSDVIETYKRLIHDLHHLPEGCRDFFFVMQYTQPRLTFENNCSAQSICFSEIGLFLCDNYSRIFKKIYEWDETNTDAFKIRQYKLYKCCWDLYT